jgi:PAS domain S-box-containing protein
LPNERRCRVLLPRCSQWQYGDLLPTTHNSQPFRRWNSPWTAGGLLLLLYVASAVGTLLFVEHGVQSSSRILSIAAPWLAAGVGVLGVLLGGTRLWPAILIGSWVVWGVIVRDAPVAVMIGAVSEAGSIVLITRLLSAWGFHRSFDRFRDPLVLLAAATVGCVLAVTFDCVGDVVSAWLAPASVAPINRLMMTDATGAFPALTPALFASSLGWALNSIAGIILVVPLASARLSDVPGALRRHLSASIAMSLALLTWSVAALALPPVAAAPLLIMALTIVAWGAIRFEPPVAAFATLTMSLVATAGVGMQLGPLATGKPIENLGLQWGFIALLTLGGLSLTAMLAERRRDLKQLSEAAERYHRLFKSNPSPLWVAAAHDGRIMMVNDEAMRRYGFSEAEFLALTVAQLAADSASPAAARDSSAGASASASRLLRHRTRAGSVIDVELLSTPIEIDGRPAELCYAVDVTDSLELRSRILAAADLERGRLAQELHDGLGQVLTGLSLGAQAAATRVSRGAGVDESSIEFLVGTSDQVVKQCQQLTRGASPLQDSNGNLLEALRRLPNFLPPHSDPRLEVDVEPQAPLGLSLERSEHLYRIAQEAVTNALKHAHAKHIRVRIAVMPETVELSIEDDGVGIPNDGRSTDGLGMRSMGLRAAAVGATLEVLEGPAGGTLIRCQCSQHEQIGIQRTAQSSASEPAEAPHGSRSAGTIPTPVLRPATLVYLRRCLLLAVACCASLAVTAVLAGFIDPRVGVNGSRLAIPSFLAGVSVAGLILGGRSLWPGIAVGTFVSAALLLHQPWPYALYYGADLALASLIAVELLSRWRFSRSFDRWQDPLLLLCAAIVGGSVIQALDFGGTMTYQWLRPGAMGPAVSALITSAVGATPVVTGAYLAALTRWWADCVAGVVLFVPVLVATPPLAQTLHGHRAALGCWCVALLGWVACMFWLNEADARLPLVAMALVLLVWAVVRFGVAMASLASSACALAATLSFELQRGVLATMSVSEGLDTLWGFLVLLAGIGMFLTALIAERNRTARELAATAQRYRRLFAHGPHPLWVQDRVTGQILMVNEQAIRLYGYSEDEWLALLIDDLAAIPAGAAPAGTAREYELVEARHRLKSGARIDVELSYAPIDMDGRPSLLCFAVDVTERNALQRDVLKATDLERMRLAEELRSGLGRTLTELEFAATRLKRPAGSSHAELATIELIARTSQQAVEVCRRIAHSATAAGNLFSGDSVARVSES